MQRLVHHEHAYRLRRFPLKKDDRLRAWDAADEYLLRYLDTESLSAPAGEVLLVNDGFGALGVVLHELAPVSWSDSYLARQALQYNLYENRLDGALMDFVPADQDPAGPFSLVLLKFPKSLAFLADQLQRLRPLLRPESLVLTGGMIKHTPKRVYQLLERIIGPTTTTLGWKKARLGISRLAERPDLDLVSSLATYRMPGSDLLLRNLPNVFSRERPDAGTRLLLAHLPQTAGELAAIDLGCGNGILAVALAGTCPQARILCADESYQAVASARLNIALLDDQTDRFSFTVGDGLDQEPCSSRDLVICNPPFHQGQTMGDLPAWTMFAQAERVLRPGGELRIVGNRHLGYHAKLKRLFKQVDLVASDERFVVLSALKKTAPA